MQSEGVPVDLYIYDLTNGLASVISPSIVGHKVEGVWHTSIVVYEREYFFGGQGISTCPPGSTSLRAPHQIKTLGNTFVPFPVFNQYIEGLATSTYAGSTYHLIDHNCNHFSDEIAQFLCGERVPKHILSQAERDLPAHLRIALTSMLDQLVPDGSQAVYANGVRHSRQDSPDYLTLNNQIEEARIASQELEAKRSTIAEKLARKERKKEKKRKKLREQGGAGDDDEIVTAMANPNSRPDSRRAFYDLNPFAKWNQPQRPGGDQPHLVDLDHPLLWNHDHFMPPGSELSASEVLSSFCEFCLFRDMAEALEAVEARDPVSLAGPSTRDLDVEAEERRVEEQRKRTRDPPVVYRDIDGVQEFEAFSKTLEGVELTAEEKQSLEELQQYLVQGEGSWVLGDEFLSFIGRILSDPSIKTSSRCGVLRCLAASALKDDVSLLLHQDRRQHALLGYAHSIDMLPLDEQRALGLFMCNLFENTSSSEWLLYISEWEFKGVALSNIRVTTKVCVQCMLSDQTDLREFGTALLYNIASKEVKTVVFDEVCVELAMAALQLTQYEPAEEHLWRTLTALARLAQHSSEVPQLIAIVGPDPSSYRGRSPRIDEQIDIIMKKVK
ncbi:unnamed protein product [Pieris brassicae]|uniref:PPPDE domain-containing protein n=1 Tax=Pieris brassicae TaxID=7116 RepID=A0A9P0WZV4_PIEBR|nr:unnamed protein product [Pieris brassicae]